MTWGELKMFMLASGVPNDAQIMVHECTYDHTRGSAPLINWLDIDDDDDGSFCASVQVTRSDDGTKTVRIDVFGEE
jgi:hypothetical protein